MTQNKLLKLNWTTLIPFKMKSNMNTHQGVVELEGTNVVSWDVGRRQRFRYLSHDPTFICRGKHQASAHLLQRGKKTQQVVVERKLTESQRLSSDTNHLPKLPGSAGEEDVVWKPEKRKFLFQPGKSIHTVTPRQLIVPSADVSRAITINGPKS